MWVATHIIGCFTFFDSPLSYLTKIKPMESNRRVPLSGFIFILIALILVPCSMYQVLGSGTVVLFCVASIYATQLVVDIVLYHTTNHTFRFILMLLIAGVKVWTRIFYNDSSDAKSSLLSDCYNKYDSERKNEREIMILVIWNWSRRSWLKIWKFQKSSTTAFSTPLIMAAKLAGAMISTRWEHPIPLGYGRTPLTIPRQLEFPPSYHLHPQPGRGTKTSATSRLPALVPDESPSGDRYAAWVNRTR